jgi:hypothetical protein
MIFSRMRTVRDRGIFAMVTLIFMGTMGLALLSVLWGLTYATAVGNTLYGATQAAAYAAANQVDFSVPTGGQLPYDCGSGFDPAAEQPRCTTGPTADVARQVLQGSLHGQLELSYPGNVQLIDETGAAFDGVLAYQIDKAPGDAHAISVALKDDTCQFPVQFNPESGQNERLCWRNPLGDIFSRDREPNWVSGVVVITQVSLPFFPYCKTSWFCPTMTYRYAVAARQGQQTPGQDWSNTP